MCLSLVAAFCLANRAVLAEPILFVLVNPSNNLASIVAILVKKTVLVFKVKRNSHLEFGIVLKRSTRKRRGDETRHAGIGKRSALDQSDASDLVDRLLKDPFSINKT